MQADRSALPPAEISRASSWFFKMLLGLSALFIAGCSAFFSVRGLGLLFIGSATAVMVMAASLEVGKLVAASFLYRYWKQITIPLRIYLTLAVLLLIGITSLGNYGYLARAYEQTHTQIAVLEQQIQGVQAEVDATQRQIDNSRTQIGKTTDNGREDRDKLMAQIAPINQALDQSLARLEDRRKAAKDKQDRDIQIQNASMNEQADVLQKGLASEEEAIAKLNERIAVLDRAVDAYTAQGGPGFLKHDGIKKGQLLRQQQEPERTSIAAEIAAHQARQDQMRSDHTKMIAGIQQSIAAAQTQYRQDLAQLDTEEQGLRKGRADAVAGVEKQVAALASQDHSDTHQGQDQVAAMYQRIQTDNDQIAQLKEQIANTDIGSYRFVARAFNASSDDLVKWLVLVLVLVFDPLAVTLTVGFNVAVMRDRRVRAAAIATTTNSSGETIPMIVATNPARRRLMALGALSVIVLIAAGVYFTYDRWQPRLAGLATEWKASSHARLVPGESFAVLAVHPSRLGPAGTDHALNQTISGLLGKSAMVELVDLFGNGFDADADIYAFVKYPTRRDAAQSQTPVMLCGLVAKVKDPALAEAGLCRFADAFAASLAPASAASSPAPLHSMVRYGNGRYLDPRGSFMSFALTDQEAIVMLEIDGDPAKPTVENEIRLTLGGNGGIDSATAGPTRGTLPTRALAKNAAISLWFDSGRCFAEMPKNVAAQNRYQQLQRQINFDLLLTINPTAQGKLDVVADYAYGTERFKPGQQPSLQDILQKLGSADSAGIPGRLIDRCAVTLDMEPLMDHMQSMLAGTDTGPGAPQVHAEKIISSERDGRFELVAQYDPKAGFPLEAALRSLIH
jgi:hypothetical protein